MGYGGIVAMGIYRSRRMRRERVCHPSLGVTPEGGEGTDSEEAAASEEFGLCSLTD